MKKLKLKHQVVWQTAHGLTASKKIVIKSSVENENRVKVDIEFVNPLTLGGNNLPCCFSSDPYWEYDTIGAVKEFFSQLFTPHGDKYPTIKPTIRFGRCWWAAVGDGGRFNIMAFNERGALALKLSLHTKDAKKFVKAFNQASEECA